MSGFPERSVKPFRLSRIPTWPLSGRELETDQANATRNHADVLGCSLFQTRDDVLSTFAALAEDETYRAKLGSVNAAPFTALAALTPEHRSTALTIAELAMNRMIEAFAHALATGEHTLPGNYSLEYRVETRLFKSSGTAARNKQVGACTLVDGDQETLLDAFKRWLSLFGNRPRS